jgi:hypothetical protein
VIRRIKNLTAAGFVFAALASPMAAQDADLDGYVEANLLSIFYHEFGHALIDLMGLPVLGQEEDAADTASVLMIDQFFDEQSAQSIIYDAAFGFLDEDAARDGDDPAWWDTHGPDLQRYYNLVCQFYGADVDARAGLADELDLPQDRAEGCEEEFELAYDSWAPIFTELRDAGPGESIVFSGNVTTLTEKLNMQEVAALNSILSLPAVLVVRVEPCDEANAFYDLDLATITMCSELDPHLRRIGTQ